MFNFLSRWLKRFSGNESGFILNPGSMFFRDEGDSENPGDLDDPFDDDQGNEDSPDPTANYDDAGVLAYLESKGTKFDSLDKLSGQSKALGDLTTAHDHTMKAQKAVRLALEKQGINYDSLLTQGMDMAGGGDGGQPTRPFTGKEPEHFRGWSNEERDRVATTADFHFERNFERSMQNIMPKIVEGLLRSIDDRDISKEEKTYEETNADYATHKEAVNAYREKHGITGRGKETREFVLKQVMRDIAEANEGLAGNEDKATKKNLRGAPPPGGGNRHAGGKGQTTLDKYRKQHEKIHADD